MLRFPQLHERIVDVVTALLRRRLPATNEMVGECADVWLFAICPNWEVSVSTMNHYSSQKTAGRIMTIHRYLLMFCFRIKRPVYDMFYSIAGYKLVSNRVGLCKHKTSRLYWSVTDTQNNDGTSCRQHGSDATQETCRASAQGKTGDIELIVFILYMANEKLYLKNVST